MNPTALLRRWRDLIIFRRHFRLRRDLAEIAVEEVIDGAFTDEAAQFVPPACLVEAFLDEMLADPAMHFSFGCVDASAGIVLPRVVLLWIDVHAQHNVAVIDDAQEHEEVVARGADDILATQGMIFL